MLMHQTVSVVIPLNMFVCVYTRERPYELTAVKHYEFVFSVVVEVFDSALNVFPFHPAPHPSSHWYKLFISFCPVINFSLCDYRLL